MPKALIIDPTDRTIREAEIEGYHAMLPFLPGGITVAYVFHETTGDVLYVDEEGLLKPPTCAFRIKTRTDGQPMMSKGILTGPDDSHMDEESGEVVDETLDVQLKPHQLEPYIEWLTLEEAFKWFEDRAGETSSYILGTDGTKMPLTVWGEYLRAMRGK